MNAQEFLVELWGAQPPGLIQTWTLATKRSEYYAAAAGVQVDGERDVFTGVALAGRRHGANHRAKAGEVVAIAGLWLDIDVPGADALSLASAVRPPTLVVHSGHGLHAWHLFEQPWRFATVAERDAAARMAWQWQAIHRAKAGGRLDATHDLARVLRLPGTVNAKQPDDPRPVTAEGGGPRHDREGLAALCAADGPATGFAPGASAAPVGQLELTGDISAFAGKLDALLANSPEFAARWEHAQPPGDDSLSAYDLSLCSLAAEAMTDAELVQLIVAHRARWGDENDQAKARRRGYLDKTITRVRSNIAAREEQRTTLDALARRAA